MTKRYFITGTDTGVGKTTITVGLLQAFKHAGLTTVGMKPLASGCQMTADGLRSDDALALQQAATEQLAYPLLNPFAYEAAIAPHLAARNIGQSLSVASLIAACQPGLNHRADLCLIEGIGGWSVPLNDTETMADFAYALNTPTILVVAIRLSCLNHALLTYQAMAAKGVVVTAWIANHSEAAIPAADECIDTLSQWLPVPLLASVAYQQDVAESVDISRL